MVRREYVCRNCRRFTTEKICPICKSTNLSQSWKGLAVINDVDSEIARKLEITSPGRYALYVG